MHTNDRKLSRRNEKRNAYTYVQRIYICWPVVVDIFVCNNIITVAITQREYNDEQNRIFFPDD